MPQYSDAQKAAIGLVAALRAPASAHAIYCQKRIDRGSGDVAEVIVVCRHPLNGQALKLPSSFQGFDVIEQPWPSDELN